MSSMNMFVPKCLARLFIVVQFLGVTVTTYAEEPAELQWPVKKIARTGASPNASDMFLFLRGSGTDWVIDMDASIYRPDVEEIWFRQDGPSGEIIVMARPYDNASSTGPGMCRYGPTAGSNERSIAGYTECNSAFFHCEASTGNALRLLPFLALGNRSCQTQFDTEAVLIALKSANVGPWIQEFKAAQKLKNYRYNFSMITSAYDADFFIRRYDQKYNPEGLVEQAVKLKEKFQSEAAIEEKKKLAELEQRKAEKLAVEQKKAERELEVQRTAREHAREIEELRDKKSREFRKKLSLGSETFCGAVIAIRGPMVQIAVNAPLPGYTAEPWLRLDEIYPATIARCTNANGRLTPIFLD